MKLKEEAMELIDHARAYREMWVADTISEGDYRNELEKTTNQILSLILSHLLKAIPKDIKRNFEEIADLDIKDPRDANALGFSEGLEYGFNSCLSEIKKAIKKVMR